MGASAPSVVLNMCGKKSSPVERGNQGRVIDEDKPPDKHRHICEMCDASTDRGRDDFADIGWTGFQIENNKMKCFCPKHSNPKAVSQLIKDDIIRGR